MSDVFEGPGWWMASDGKWYAPERHPDPTYRTRFEVGADSDSGGDLTSVSTETALRDEPDEPSSEVAASEPTSQEPDRQPHAIVKDEFVTEPMADAAPEVDEPPSQAASPFSVAPPPHSPDPSSRPVFDIQPPASVVEAPEDGSIPTAPPTPERQSKTRLRLEGDLPVEKAPPTTRGGFSPTPMSPPVAPATSTAMVHVPTRLEDEATGIDRLLATLIFAAGVAMIVGSFLTWTQGAVTQTGWDRGDGIFTIVAGVLGSAAAGPIYVGFRHVLPKFVAIVSGLFGLVVVGLVAIGALFDDLESTSLGAGFGVVLFASIVMVAAGLADRGEILD